MASNPSPFLDQADHEVAAATPKRGNLVRNLVIGGVIAVVAIAVPAVMYQNAQAEKHEAALKMVAERAAADAAKAKRDAELAELKELADKRAKEKAEADAKEALRAGASDAEKDRIRGIAASDVDRLRAQAEADAARKVADAKQRAENAAQRDADIKLYRETMRDVARSYQNEAAEQRAQREQAAANQHANDQRAQLRAICMQRYNRPDC